MPHDVFQYYSAGDCGVAVVGIDGQAYCGENGIAIARGENARVKGGLRSILIIQTIDENGDVALVKTRTVDGKHIKADTWYTLKDGKFEEAES